MAWVDLGRDILEEFVSFERHIDMAYERLSAAIRAGNNRRTKAWYRKQSPEKKKQISAASRAWAIAHPERRKIYNARALAKYHARKAGKVTL